MKKVLGYIILGLFIIGGIGLTGVLIGMMPFWLFGSLIVGWIIFCLLYEHKQEQIDRLERENYELRNKPVDELVELDNDEVE